MDGLGDPRQQHSKIWKALSHRRREPARITGLLPAQQQISTRGNVDYSSFEMRLFQQLCKLFPAHDQQQLLTEWVKCQATQLDAVASEDIAKLTLEDVRANTNAPTQTLIPHAW
jgi:hypothetical protein